jgi:hypothetical protein
VSWQPIESAPKDGTWVLLFGAGWKLPEVGQWSMYSNVWQNMDSELCGATHWVSLPEPPRGTGGEKR